MSSSDQPKRYELDFSGSARDETLAERGTFADAQARHAPEMRGVASGIAASEERRGRSEDRLMFRSGFFAVVAASMTAGVDLGVGQLLGMQQILLREEVREGWQQAVHSGIIGVGAIPTLIFTGLAAYHMAQSDGHHQRAYSATRDIG